MFKAARQVIKNVGQKANWNVLKNNMSRGVNKVKTFNAARGARDIRKGMNMKMTGSQFSAARDDILRSGSNKMGKMYNAVRPVVKPVSYAGMFALGATAMTGVAVMNGAMSAASDSMATRYMKDSRYSSKVLQNRVGRAHGNGSLSIGNHAGLSLSMSRARHG